MTFAVLRSNIQPSQKLLIFWRRSACSWTAPPQNQVTQNPHPTKPSKFTYPKPKIRTNLAVNPTHLRHVHFVKLTIYFSDVMPFLRNPLMTAGQWSNPRNYVSIACEVDIQWPRASLNFLVNHAKGDITLFYTSIKLMNPRIKSLLQRTQPPQAPNPQKPSTSLNQNHMNLLAFSEPQLS